MSLRDDIKDFLTFPSIEEQIGAKPKFGRLILKDERNKEYPLKKLLRSAKPTVKARKERIWRPHWQGNQGNTSMCTAYSFLHYFEHDPVRHPRSYGKYKDAPYPCIDPRILYCEAQQLDPWPGGCNTGQPDSYDGTSVLAMMQVAQARGYISEYHWETKDVDNVAQAVLLLGPVIIGSDWYRNMMLRQGDKNTPDSLLLATGPKVGGHAYLIDEINLTSKRKGREVGIFNSWGIDWGWAGRAYMSLDTLEKLMREDGEVCIATEIK